MKPDYSKLVPVRFVRSHSPYGIDEVAGFQPDVAEKLISNGIAVAYVAEKVPSKREKLGENKEMAAEESKGYVTK